MDSQTLPVSFAQLRCPGFGLPVWLPAALGARPTSSAPPATQADAPGLTLARPTWVTCSFLNQSRARRLKYGDPPGPESQAYTWEGASCPESQEWRGLFPQNKAGVPLLRGVMGMEAGQAPDSSHLLCVCLCLFTD